ncbi:hypothetical protein [Pseudoruegeria sp. SK021]|uniref:hypothetical protein n=1 Tax=Pseudoruegeria sp. SK021 TaxID=1933035 RepID=UPI001F0A8A89|nr:hypothetical protein [Pseudoruegeria sp. SK021]
MEMTMSFFNSLRTAAQKRAAFHRTAAELRNMSEATARDLNLVRDDAEKIARTAVYGN